jgi:hypothetical protein
VRRREDPSLDPARSYIYTSGAPASSSTRTVGPVWRLNESPQQPACRVHVAPSMQMVRRCIFPSFTH